MTGDEDPQGRHRPHPRRQGPRQAGPRPRGAPARQRVLVENLNMVKRHSKPQPIKNPSRMGGAQFTPGSVIDLAAPIPISNVMLVCPTCNRPTRIGYVDAGAQGRGSDQGARLQARRLRPGDRQVMATATQTAQRPRLKERYDDELRARLKDELGLSSVMQVPRLTKITLNMGVGDGEGRGEGARRPRIGGADDDRRPARAGAQGPQVDRRLQAPRGHAHRRARHAARRRGCGSSSTAWSRSRFRASATSAASRPELVRRPRQLLDRHPRADHLPGDQLRRHPGRARLDVAITTTAQNDDEGYALSCGASAFRSERRKGCPRVAAEVTDREGQARAALQGAAYSRCNRCGRPRAVYKKFGLCRICLRDLAHEGEIPGMTKSSW